MDDHPDFDVVVIGAGFAGLYALHKFRDDLNLSVRVFEAGDGVGGTWYWNRYPGARCDSESYYYCYSFSPELAQEWEWSGRYPEQPEIERYLNHVADRFDLRRDIQLSTRVTAATFDDATNRWKIRTDRGDTVTARFLVTAVGCLSAPIAPDIPGLDGYEGDVYFTATWPREGVDFTGKRVGLIGTGSSGIQATPPIAAQAEHLTVFQRTPNFSLPARHGVPGGGPGPDQGTLRRDLRRDPQVVRRVPVLTDRPQHDERLAEEREAILEGLWEEGGFKFLWGGFSDLLSDPEANEIASEYIRNKIRETVKDPETAELLCPKGYPYGAKRPPIDTDYYETFNRDNVTLVDIGETPIEAITPTGLRTTAARVRVRRHRLRDRLRRHDRFAAAHGHPRRGRRPAGRRVGGRAPHLARPPGRRLPQPVHDHRTRQPVGAHEHARRDRVSRRLDRRVHRLPARPRLAPHRGHRGGAGRVGRARRRGRASSLFGRANSWYVGANIPGKPRVVMPYAGGQPRYRERCNAVRDAGYEGFEFGGIAHDPVVPAR